MSPAKPRSHTFVAHGKPQVKQRPRMTRRGKAFTPQATLEAEQALAAQYDGPYFEGPLSVEIEYLNDRQTITITEIADWENRSKLRGDLDNYIKLLDGLNGVAWADDRQVKHVTARML